MEQIASIAQFALDFILKGMGVKFESDSKIALQWFTEKMNSFSADIWNAPFIVGLMNFVGGVGVIMFVYSLLQLLSDIGRQIDTIDWKTVLITVGEAIMYVYTIRYIGMLLFSFAEQFIQFFSMELDITNITFGDILIPSFIQNLFILIIIGVFFILNYYRVACMLIHLIASVLYIPFIVRGDVQKIADWLTTATAIAITYIIQFIAMYISINFWMELNLHFAIIFLVVAFSVGGALKEFGYTTGAKNGISSISRSAVSLAQGAKLLMR